MGNPIKGPSLVRQQVGRGDDYQASDGAMGFGVSVGGVWRESEDEKKMGGGIEGERS